MKKLMTLAFAALVAFTLSMPLMAQNTKDAKAQTAAKKDQKDDKKAADKKKKADKKAADKKAADEKKAAAAASKKEAKPAAKKK